MLAMRQVLGGTLVVSPTVQAKAVLTRLKPAAASRQRNPWQTSPEALDFTMNGLGKRSEPEVSPDFMLGGAFPANSIAGTRM
jgi:hypothetical protein